MVLAMETTRQTHRFRAVLGAALDRGLAGERMGICVKSADLAHRIAVKLQERGQPASVMPNGDGWIVLCDDLAGGH